MYPNCYVSPLLLFSAQTATVVSVLLIEKTASTDFKSSRIYFIIFDTNCFTVYLKRSML